MGLTPNQCSLSQKYPASKGFLFDLLERNAPIVMSECHGERKYVNTTVSITSLSIRQESLGSDYKLTPMNLPQMIC